MRDVEYVCVFVYLVQVVGLEREDEGHNDKVEPTQHPTELLVDYIHAHGHALLSLVTGIHEAQMVEADQGHGSTVGGKNEVRP